MIYEPAIIVMDLDDTLLRQDLTISDRTVRVLGECSARGISIMLASGRSPEAMFPYSRRIGLDRMQSYLICNNGSQTIRSDTGEMVIEHRLPTEIAIEAFRLTVDAGLSCHIYENDVIYVSKETEFSERDRMLSGLKPIIPADYEELIRKGVYKLVIPGDPEFIVPVEAEFKVLFRDRATVFVSKPFFLEVLPRDVGKGEALREIAEGILGVGRDRVMAFGDSMNDCGMLRTSGWGVAMGNAPAGLLLAADRVTGTVEEDGVVAELRRLGLLS